jgi:hypothetical protein
LFSLKQNSHLQILKSSNFQITPHQHISTSEINHQKGLTPTLTKGEGAVTARWFEIKFQI